MVGLHAPDGFLEPWVAAVTAVIAVIVTSLALRASEAELGDRRIPLAGIAAAFIFAAQMFNFPVASGTTGHLVGGLLAAVLLGPWVGSLVVTIVIVVQALVFADGGITALGYNTINMAIVPAFGGWAVFQGFRRVLPRSSGGVIGASALAAAVSVVLAAVAFSLQWLFGASAPIPFDTVFGAMVGVHILIGIGEGVITGLVVGAVLAARPDLVAGAADLTPAQLSEGPRVAHRTFIMGAVIATMFTAAVISQFAVDDPDGLEMVAEEKGFIEEATDHALGNGVFADYATRGIGNETLSLAVAGVSGAVLTLAVALGLIAAQRRVRASAA